MEAIVADDGEWSKMLRAVKDSELSRKECRLSVTEGGKG